MRNEKAKPLIYRITALTLLLMIVFLPLIMDASKPEIELLEDECYAEYYEYLDESNVEMYLTFNRDVYSIYATVKFYDAQGVCLETKRIEFYGYGKDAESFYTTVQGNVDSYEIVEYEYELAPALDGYIHYPLIFIALIFLILAFLPNYKEYEYSGRIISVYAGLMHYTLRVNGELYDKHTTLNDLVSINLSTILEDGTHLWATISSLRRITLKINNIIAKNTLNRF